MNDDHSPSNNTRKLLQKINHFFNKQGSKDELREYLQDAQDKNVIGIEEAAMMAGVLAVSEQRVRDVMLPKSKMVVVQHDMPFDETVKLVLDSGHSRFPVEKDETIIGILLAKDLLNYLHKDRTAFSVMDVMRPALYIPESKPLDVLLRDFRHQRSHMMIVSSEYGDIGGLITIEDVIEEIVGEIGDEHDNEALENIRKINEKKYLVAALTEVDEFNDYFAADLDVEASDTIGGFVLSHFGYVPRPGEQTSFSGLQFTIRQADDRRIIELLVER